MNSKYIKYALGEIALVVIGILIALSINNWNEERKMKMVSNQTMINLQKEIETSLVNLNRALEFNTTNSRNVSEYLYGELENDITDSLKTQIVYNSLTFAPLSISLPILENELSSDHKIIQSEELLIQLRAINETKKTLYQINDLMEDGWRTYGLSYLYKTESVIKFYGITKGIDQFKNSLSSLYDDQYFKNIVSSQQIGKDSHNQFMSRLKKQLNDLDFWLKENIEK